MFTPKPAGSEKTVLCAVWANREWKTWEPETTNKQCWRVLVNIYFLHCRVCYVIHKHFYVYYNQ